MSYGITPWDVSGSVMNLNPIGPQNSFKQNWVVLQSGAKKPNGTGDDLAFVPDHDIHDVSWSDMASIQIQNNAVKQMKQKFDYEGVLNVISSQTGFDAKHSLLEQELDKDDDLDVFLSHHQSENVQNVCTVIEDELESWLLEAPAENNNNTNNSSAVTPSSGLNVNPVSANNSSGNGDTDLLPRNDSSSGHPATAPAQNSRTANAAANLALAAQRAAGLIPQSAGGDAFNRVRTTSLRTITATSIPKWANPGRCKTMPPDPASVVARGDPGLVQKSTSNASSEQQSLTRSKTVPGYDTDFSESERLMIGADRHLMAETAIPLHPSGACPQDKLKVMQKGDLPQKPSQPSSASMNLNFPQFSRPVAMYSRPYLQQFDSAFCQMGNSDLLNVSRDNNSSESSLTESTPVDVTCSYPDPYNSQPLTSPSVIQSVVKAGHDYPFPDNSAQQLQYRDQQQFQTHQQASGQTTGVPQRLDTRSIPSNGASQGHHSMQSSRPYPQQNTKTSEVNIMKNDSHFSGSMDVLRDTVTGYSNQLGMDHLQSQSYPEMNGSARNHGIPCNKSYSGAVFQDEKQWSHYAHSFQGVDIDKAKIRDYSLYAQKMALMNWDKSNKDATDSVSLLPSVGDPGKDECENSFQHAKAASSPSAVQSDEYLLSTKSERNRPSPNEALDNTGMENKRMEPSVVNPIKTKRARDEEIANGAVSTSQMEASQENKGSRGAMDAASKRSRAAEVHNLSERRRRDRINEKMRELQNLIPNSNKTDKASMLDEAIEYLKMLQQQLQVMAMKSETDNQKWQALQAMYSNHLYSYGDILPLQSCLGPMQMQNPPMHLMPPMHHSQFGNSNWQLHPSFPNPPHSMNPLLSSGMHSPLHPGMMKTSMTTEGLNRASEMSSGGVGGLRSSGMESFPEAFVPGPNNVLNSRGDPIRNLPSIQPALRGAALPLADPDILRSLRMHPNPSAYHLGRGGNPMQEADVSGLKPQGLPNQRRSSGNFPMSAPSESLNSKGFRNDPSAKLMKHNDVDSSSLLQESSCWNSVSSSEPHLNNGPPIPFSLPSHSTGSASAFPSMDNSFLPSHGVIKSETANHSFLYPESRSSMFDYSRGEMVSGFNASRVDTSDLMPAAARFHNSNSKPVDYGSDMCFPTMVKTMDDLSRNF